MKKCDWRCPRCGEQCRKDDRFCWMCKYDADKEPPDEWLHADDPAWLYIEVLR